MQKIFILSVLILVWVVRSQAQQVVDADKNYASPLKSNVVSVTATATLNGKPDADAVNRSDYHRAVLVEEESGDKTMQPPVVEITVAAQPANMVSGNTTVKKEAITITPQNSIAVQRSTPAMIEIIVPAVKQ